MVTSVASKFKKDISRNAEEKYAQIAQEKENKQLVEQQYREEAAESTDNVMGSTSLEGTGYTSFEDLVIAKRKKQKQLDEESNRKTVSNFASLLGKGTTLG